MQISADEIEIRVSEPEDFAVIQEIREIPLVAEQQFVDSGNTSKYLWLAHLTSEIGTRTIEWQSSTILVQSKIVGHVMEFNRRTNTEYKTQLGWNLHPDYWGKGIMTRALDRYLTSLFEDDNCKEVTADCFAGNQRCISLLERLQFRPATIGYIERLLTWTMMKCPHRILRYQISPGNWNPIDHRPMGDWNAK